MCLLQGDVDNDVVPLAVTKKLLLADKRNRAHHTAVWIKLIDQFREHGACIVVIDRGNLAAVNTLN